MELAFHLKFEGDSIAARLLADVVSPANSLCQQVHVTPWPERGDIVSLDGNVLKIRWQKGQLFWIIIWDIVRPLLLLAGIGVVIFLLFWVLSRYVVKNPAAAAGILGLVLVVSTPIWLPAVTGWFQGRSRSHA